VPTIAFACHSAVMTSALLADNLISEASRHPRAPTPETSMAKLSRSSSL